MKTPALILHRIGDKVCHVENARWLSQNLEGSRYIELPGDDHLPWIEGDDILDEIQEFLTGVREPADPDRVLATVLFTDVVGSTERARELGDKRWRDLLDHHNEIVRRDLERFRGREVDSAGDGFFATFDGPARAIRCARSVVTNVRTLGLEVRAGYTPVSASLQATTFEVSRCTPERVSPHSQAPEKCSCRARFAISSQDRESSSPTAVFTHSRGFRANGGSTP